MQLRVVSNHKNSRKQQSTDWNLLWGYFPCYFSIWEFCVVVSSHSLPVTNFRRWQISASFDLEKATGRKNQLQLAMPMTGHAYSASFVDDWWLIWLIFVFWWTLGEFLVDLSAQTAIDCFSWLYCRDFQWLLSFEFEVMCDARFSHAIGAHAHNWDHDWSSFGALLQTHTPTHIHFFLLPVILTSKYCYEPFTKRAIISSGTWRGGWFSLKLEK